MSLYLFLGLGIAASFVACYLQYLDFKQREWRLGEREDWEIKNVRDWRDA